MPGHELKHQVRCPWCGVLNDLPDEVHVEMFCGECGYVIDVPATLAEMAEDRRLRELGAPTLPGLEEVE